jgi:hypothetical protein
MLKFYQMRFAAAINKEIKIKERKMHNKTQTIQKKTIKNKNS